MFNGETINIDDIRKLIYKLANIINNLNNEHFEYNMQ